MKSRKATAKKPEKPKNKTAGQKKSAAAENNNIIRESYDDLPYESYAYPQTHPDRMHTIATLFGMTAPDVQKARTLELGCGMGGNIIPIAMLRPRAQLVGIDISKEQIMLANKHKQAMGLKNIEFLQRDITNLEPGLGQFDYIICHGVFSWVPDSVRDAIFRICRRHLAKNGLAIITYNALPGWSAIRSLREMMLYHTKNFRDPKQQIFEARQLLNFLYENTPPNNESYRQIIDHERKIVNATNDTYVFHEHLELENHQFYLHQFAEMAAANDLAYVGDAEVSTMYLGNFNEKVQKTLGAIKDIIQQEQYIDFLSNRRFRHSIITHKENSEKINRSINQSDLAKFYIHARYVHDARAGQDIEGTRFALANNLNTHFTVKEKDSALIFAELSKINRPVTIDELAKRVKKVHGLAPEFTRDILLKNGFLLILQNFISLHSSSRHYCEEVSKKPKAFAWARYLAETQDKNSLQITNMRGESTTLSPFTKMLLVYCDGKHTEAQMIDKMTAHILNDDLKIHKQQKRVTEEKEVREILKDQVSPALKKFAWQALLEA